MVTQLTPKEVAEALTEDSASGRALTSAFFLWEYFDRLRTGRTISKSDLKTLKTQTIKACTQLGKMKKSNCEHAFDNGVWQACQEVKDDTFKLCKDASYTVSASDVFSSPYFWGGLGFFLGILFVTMDFLLLYCLCLKKKNKGMNTGKGSGSQETSKTPVNQGNQSKQGKPGKSKFFKKGSKSQETAQTPRNQTPGSATPSATPSKTPSKTPNNGSNENEYQNLKKHQLGLEPNKETYMY